MSEKNIILFAAGSPIIVDFEELCLKNDIHIEAIVVNQSQYPCQALALDKVIDLAGLKEGSFSAPFICPLFTPKHRYEAVSEALALGLHPFGLLSDKNNDLPGSLAHGAGCFINRKVVIDAVCKMGNYVFINRGATLGHHLHLDDFVSIGPGVTTGGNVTIETGASIGTGAVILPGKSIGRHAVVGGGAVVTKDVKEYEIVMGNPAKVIKKNDKYF